MTKELQEIKTTEKKTHIAMGHGLEHGPTVDIANSISQMQKSTTLLLTMHDDYYNELIAFLGPIKCQHPCESATNQTST